MMKRIERERLIEQYFEGKMSPGEEHDFFIQVAMDKELRRELKAHRAIESAMRKEREGERSEHTQLRSRVAATLSASHEPAHHQASPAHPAKTAGFLSVNRRWLAAATGILMLSIGILLFIPSTDRENEQNLPALPQESSQNPSLPNTSPLPLPTDRVEQQKTPEATQSSTVTPRDPGRKSPPPKTEVRAAPPSTPSSTIDGTEPRTDKTPAVRSNTRPNADAHVDSAHETKAFPSMGPIEWPPRVSSEEDDSIDIGINLNIDLPE